MPASGFELSAEDWPLGHMADSHEKHKPIIPLHLRFVAIKYGIKVFFRDFFDDAFASSTPQKQPIMRSVRPRDASVTLIASNGSTLELHVGPSCVNMFTLEELECLAAEYTVSVKAPGWKVCKIRIGNQDLPHSPDAMFRFKAQSFRLEFRQLP